MTARRPAFLAPLQAACYTLVQQQAEGCFLYLSKSQDSLFISDAPRHMPAARLPLAMGLLEESGFHCRLLPRGLLSLDPSLDQYRALLQSLPLLPPSLPKNNSLHPAYALCRLLLGHPTCLSLQPLAPLRQLLKASRFMPYAKQASHPMLTGIPKLHSQCAAWLRQGMPLPQAAGQVLSAWLPLADE